MRRNGYRETDTLVGNFALKRDAIRRRLSEFAAVPPEEYYYELAYCILTPQSSAVRAGSAVEALKRADIMRRDVNPAPILRTASSYIRFHNTKARNLIEARDRFGMIVQVLQQYEGAQSH